MGYEIKYVKNLKELEHLLENYDEIVYFNRDSNVGYKVIVR